MKEIHEVRIDMDRAVAPRNLVNFAVACFVPLYCVYLTLNYMQHVSFQTHYFIFIICIILLLLFTMVGLFNGYQFVDLLILALRKHDLFIFDEHGISDHSFAFSQKTIPWDNISGIDLKTMDLKRNSPRNQDMQTSVQYLAIKLYDYEPYLESQAIWNRWIARRSIKSQEYPIKMAFQRTKESIDDVFPVILELYNQYRNR